MTRILDLEETPSRVDGLIHLDTQQAAAGIDLTAGEIFRLTGPGSLDFGGSELEAAERAKVEPELRDEDDDYGWWELEPGSYLVRYNESLAPADGELAVVFPLERLLLAGASHAAFVADGRREPLQALLSVGAAGCHIKENARVSRMIVQTSE